MAAEQTVITDHLIVEGGSSSVLVSGATYTCDYDKGNGLAIEVLQGGTLTGSDVVISGNTWGGVSEDEFASALHSMGVVDLKNVLFCDNVGYRGGAASVDIPEGTADEGFDKIFNLTGCTFANNSGSNWGGALFVGAGTVTLTDCLFTDNTETHSSASSSWGGAIYHDWGTDELILSGVTFSGNTAGKGGAINSSGNMTLAGDVVLATASDIFYKSNGEVAWHIGVDGNGRLDGYQNLTIYTGQDARMVLDVDENFGYNRTFIIASGDFSDLTDKDTFKFHDYQQDDYRYWTTITINGDAVQFGGLTWSLTVDDNGTAATDDDLLKLTSSGGKDEYPRADYNVSGRSDVVMVSKRRLYILADDVKGKYVKSGALSGLGKWTVVAPEGDYDGDSRADVLITLKGTLYGEDIRTIGGLFNVGEDSEIKFKAHSIFSYKTSQWAYRGEGDINGDGTTDVVIVLSGTTAKEKGLKGRVVQAKMLNENGKVGETVKMGMLKSGECVLGTADVTGKRKSNILIWNTKTDMIGYWKSAGDKVTEIGKAVDLTYIISGDFNGDGADELIWQNDDGEYVCWENLAAASIKESNLGAGKSGWTFQKQIGDYNADGREELLWAAADGRLAYSNTDKITKLTVIAK